MSLLHDISPRYVRTGWWRNLAAPPHRQYLLTTGNVEAVMIVGCLGVLGAIAGNRVWIIVRYYLQPALQLSDPESERGNLSRSDAIKSLWAAVNHQSKNIREVLTEEEDFGHKVGRMLDILSGNGLDRLHPMDTKIELRFGIFAVLTIVCLGILSTLIPFFLTEGLQGGTAVLATHGSDQWYLSAGLVVIGDLRLRNSVHRDISTCVNDGIYWNQTKPCLELRSTLPSYSVEHIGLTDLNLSHASYRLLTEQGDKNFEALRLRHEISLQDAGFNTNNGGRKLHHELTCIPTSAEQLITKVNGTFNLNIEKLVPPSGKEFNPEKRGSYILHRSMMLRTANGIGSGHEIDESKRRSGFVTKGTDPLENFSGDGATWYQAEVDAALPRVDIKHPETDGFVKDTMHWAGATELMAYDGRGHRLQNFLITFKPGEIFPTAQAPSDDPIFAAHRQENSQYIADREVSALACTELFKICSKNTCEEINGFHSSSPEEAYLKIYAAILSVWASTTIEPIYGDPTTHQRVRNFFEKMAIRRRRKICPLNPPTPTFPKISS
ncbi:unnamed protein product [Periconia digitata]|uniref:Uncharacterized protein n=1 Tax=Periconia digitata TaxID=1303443 RepID=A0A9W4XIG7_9PLEO|nr:unnamed protein product [Periconia digitata]